MNPRKTLIAALLLFLGVLLIAALVADVRHLQAAFTRYPIVRILPACALVLGNYALRTVRFRTYLAAVQVRLGWREAFLVFTSGFVATVSPGKMGEIFKGYLLHQRRGASIADVATVVVAERYTDVIGLLALGAVALGLGGVQLGDGKYGPLLGILVGLSAVFLVAVSHPRLIPRLVGAVHARVRRPWLVRTLQTITRIHAVLRVLCTPRRLLLGTGLAAAAWLLEGVAFRVLLDGTGAGGGLAAAVVVYAVATLVGAASMLPGGVGSTEAVMIALLLTPAIGLGLDRETATLATLLIRFCTLWFGVLAGVACLAVLRRWPVSEPGAAPPSEQQPPERPRAPGP
jgi:uncharacterized protein (TIRG00374 family)